MTVGWFDVLQDAVYDALCATFHVDPTVDSSLARFVPAYVDEATTPQAPRNVNVCYYAISELDDPGTDFIQAVTREVKGVTKTQLESVVPVSVLLTFYGPNADNDAEYFKKVFMWDSGAESPRAVLRRLRIVPIGKPSRPIAVFEVEGTYHRRRCDVRLNLAYLDITELNASAVEQPPEIQSVFQYNN